MELLDLCYDVLMGILEMIDPADLASCAQTCSALNGFIKGNTRLFRSQYLANWDDFRTKPTGPEPDWIAAVKQMVSCHKILESRDMQVKRQNFASVARTIEALVHTASSQRGESLNEEYLERQFQLSGNKSVFLRSSSLYSRNINPLFPVPTQTTEEDRQLSAKLHCLYGMALGARGRRSLSVHPYARSHIYDLRNYIDETKWGPFRDDGSMRVDWEMIEAVMIDLSYNSDACCPRFLAQFKPPWCEPFGGLVGNGHQALSLPVEPELPLELRDPYNVSGIWRRIVCFLDYNDLWRFNFYSTPLRPDLPRGPLFEEEAIRHVVMHLFVTDIKPPGRFDNPALPIVFFEGVSQLAEKTWDPDASSRIRGKVRLTSEGEVRWTTVSIFAGGEERWKSEGIQVGGRNSKRGVVGMWFDKDYDDHGPVGPTAFWKVKDGVSSGGSDSDGEASDDGSL